MTPIPDTPGDERDAMFGVCVQGTFLRTKAFGRRAIAAGLPGAEGVTLWDKAREVYNLIPTARKRLAVIGGRAQA